MWWHRSLSLLLLGSLAGFCLVASAEPASGGSFRAAVERAQQPAESPPEPTVDPLADCRLADAVIHCPERRFELQRNRPNRQLVAGVLELDNQLGLQAYEGELEDEDALQAYLVASYRRYIQKMLEIGLGAATMSYTRFYYTYLDVVGGGEDFVQRFETMFDYLQKDKAAMAVNASYTDTLPTDISQCDSLSPRLVVCDNRQTNWVYLAH